jgi:hypothetical protein
MTMTLSGDSGITYPNSSTQANSLVGFKNRVIDGGFIINQRGYTSGTSLSSGSYGHDRWKGGGSGGTYTFTQGSTGVNTTITITAGSIQQVIEGCNMPEGGSYTLSWTGTAQGKIAGGSYSSSPVTATGLTAGANCTIEFNTGTVGSVQVEAGSTATSFDYRPYGTELILCQRYCHVWTSGGSSYCQLAVGYTQTNSANTVYKYPQIMRTTPTATFSEQNKWLIDMPASSVTTTSISVGYGTPEQTRILPIVASGVTSGNPCAVANNGDAGTRTIIFSAEL